MHQVLLPPLSGNSRDVKAGKGLATDGGEVRKNLEWDQRVHLLENEGKMFSAWREHYLPEKNRDRILPG